MIKVDRLEWEHHLECQKLAAEVDADQATFAEMKKAAMDVKSSISGKLVKLRRMLQNGPERLPLFDGPTAAPPQPVKAKAGKSAKGSKNKAGSATAQTAAPPTASKPADPDAWRAAPIQESLHKPGNRALTIGINALLKGGILTVGQLEDRRAKGFGWTDSIDGFGEASVTAVEDAVAAFLTRTRDKGVFAEAAAQALKRPTTRRRSRRSSPTTAMVNLSPKQSPTIARATASRLRKPRAASAARINRGRVPSVQSPTGGAFVSAYS